MDNKDLQNTKILYDLFFSDIVLSDKLKNDLKDEFRETYDKLIFNYKYKIIKNRKGGKKWCKQL